MTGDFSAGMAGPPGQLPVRGDDLIQPFKLENQAVRGRLVRLGPLVQSVLARHR